MNSEENFKEKLNGLLESKSFPFDEGAWKDMEQTLDADKAKRRGGLGMFLAGLLMITGGSMLCTYNPHAPVRDMLAQHSAVAGSPLAPSVKTTSNKNSAVVETPANPAAAPSVKHAVDPDVPATPGNATGVRNPRNLTGSTPVETKPIVPQSKINTPGAPSAMPENTIVPEHSSIGTTESGKKQTPPSAADITPAKQDQGNSDDHASAPGTEVAPVTSPKPEDPKDAFQSAASSGIATPSQSPVSEVSNTAIALQAAPDLTFKDSVPAPSVSPAIIQPDTSGKTVSTPPPASTPEHVLLLSFEGGGSLLAGWKQNNTREGSGMNITAGFNYYTCISDKLYFSAGLQYNRIGHLALNSQVSKITRFNLGEESDVTIITPQSLHYLTIPVRLNAFVTKRDMITGGFNISYLLNADSKVETYHERLNVQENYKTYTTGGYTEGISWYDLQMVIGYRRNVWKDLQAGVDIFAGFTDIKDNVFFGSNTFERPWGCRIVLQYNIFKNK